jgi:DNA repair photolyase
VCSFQCAYCFANLGEPGRTANPGRIMRLLRDHQERDTLTAYLLRERYPVLVSNRDDIFAPSNWVQGRPILETMTELGIPLAFQTKGGPHATEALRWLKPACWYVSLAMLDDDLRRRVEPQAPSVPERLALIAELRAAGHRALAGINPAVPEWLPDARPLVQALRDAGAEGIWTSRLHLNYRQIGQMTARGRQAMSEPVIERARRRAPDTADWDVLTRVYQAAADAGLPIYSAGLPAPTAFWQPYRETYQRSFPLLADLINYAWRFCAAGQILHFSDYWALMGDRLPRGVWGLDSYLGANARQLWWQKRIPTDMTFRELLQIVWSEPTTPACPARNHLFAYLGHTDGTTRGWTQYVDADDLPLLVYTPQGSERLWIDIDDLPRAEPEPEEE